MLKQIVQDELRLLIFRSPSRAIVTDWKAYLAFGLFFTWFAGVGRYWDNPRAELWRRRHSLGETAVPTKR